MGAPKLGSEAHLMGRGLQALSHRHNAGILNLPDLIGSFRDPQYLKLKGAMMESEERGSGGVTLHHW